MKGNSFCSEEQMINLYKIANYFNAKNFTPKSKNYGCITFNLNFKKLNDVVDFIEWFGVSFNSLPDKISFEHKDYINLTCVIYRESIDDFIWLFFENDL